jgi:outer membrane protein assembly factor BamA
MRCCLARAVVFAVAWVTGCQTPVHAQGSIPARNDDVHAGRVCPAARSSRGNQPSGREVSIAGLLGSSSSLELPISDQEQITAFVTQRKYAGSLAEVKTEVEERLRGEWQKRGYFKVEISADGNILTIGPAKEQIVFTAHIKEGSQYRLQQIGFKNDKAIVNTRALRDLFPIKDGDVFDREAIAKGLENLREAYGQQGYVNFTSIPNTTINEEERTISLDVDVDEGKQFYISSIDVKGADAQVLNDLALKPGDVYNERLVEKFLQKRLSGVDVNSVQRVLNERDGTVALTFDFRQCPPE